MTLAFLNQKLSKRVGGEVVPSTPYHLLHRKKRGPKSSSRIGLNGFFLFHTIYL